MSEKNKHGLSRVIPDPIKREVRKKCGFGCVICGLAITEYEHVDPEFKEAKEHNPDNIVLLCGSCHSKVTRGIWSKNKVHEAAKNPCCIRRGYASDAFDIGTQHPIIKMGETTWIDTTTILEVMGEKILVIEPPEEAGAPFRLSGLFFDENENELFRIRDNEFMGSKENWDIECVGSTLTIRKKSRKIALQLIVSPPDKISISRIDMTYKGATIKGSQSKFTAIAPDNSTVTFGSYKGKRCMSGVLIKANEILVCS